MSTIIIAAYVISIVLGLLLSAACVRCLAQLVREGDFSASVKGDEDGISIAEPK